MTIFNRFLISDQSGLAKKARAGQGLVAAAVAALIATDANLTLTTAQMSGGIVQFTGFTAARVVTTPTAAQLNAAAPDMDIGDSFVLGVSVVPAFAATWAAGTGITLAGRATTPAASFTWILVTKTAAAAFTWNVL